MKKLKTCGVCKVQLDLHCFSLACTTKDGLQSKCKGCDKEYRKANKDKIAEYQKEYQESNKPKIAECKKEHYKSNKDKIAEYRKEYQESNKPKIAALNKAWKKANPAKVNAYNAKRRASKLKATPRWLTIEDLKLIEQFYIDAQNLTQTMGILHHVDHVVPLQGEDVCGLHVPWNLQVITATENLIKSNREVELYE